jgi:hypothetical protein
LIDVEGELFGENFLNIFCPKQFSFFVLRPKNWSSGYPFTAKISKKENHILHLKTMPPNFIPLFQNPSAKNCREFTLCESAPTFN